MRLHLKIDHADQNSVIFCQASGFVFSVPYALFTQECRDPPHSLVWPLIRACVCKRGEPVTDKRLCREAGPVVSNYSLDSAASVYLLRIHAHTCAHMQMCTFYDTFKHTYRGAGV